jgi:hypothetical protein
MPVFTLRNKEAAAAAWKFIRDNAAEQARIGQPLVVSVDAYAAKRSTQANSRYWALLDDISEQAEIDGKRFSRDVWHEFYKNMFAPKQEGPRGLVAMSTSQMNKTQFQSYTTQIEFHAINELGVEFLEV